MARPPTALGPRVAVNFPESPMGTGRPEDGGGPLDGGLWMPSRFPAEVDDPELPYLVTLVLGAHNRRLVCESVTVTMRMGGRPVTATSLRSIKVDAYVAQARTKLAEHEGGLKLMRRNDDQGVTQWTSVPDKEWPSFEQSQARRRRPEDTLPEVAATYREALGHQYPHIAAAPTKYVADTLHYSRGHASRLLTQARRAGLLGPASPGQAGEIESPDGKKGQQ